jgi:hypothetical protein
LYVHQFVQMTLRDFHSLLELESPASIHRLLLLNHQRHAEEVAAGLVDESGKPLKSKAKAAKGAKHTVAQDSNGASLANYWTTSAASGDNQASAKETADYTAQGDEEQTTLL